MTSYVLLASAVAGQLSVATAAQPGSCSAAMATGLSAAAAEICLGEAQLRQASALGEGRERSRLWIDAIPHYRRAVTLASDAGTKVRALEALTEVYDANHLNQLDQVEQTLRELIALQPSELEHAFRLAKVQEDQQLIASAEETLLTARREHQDAVDAYVMLAQFYARRAMALRKDAEGQNPQVAASASGEPDERGVYRIGGPVKAPSRVGTPQYPADALAAGIEGVVIAEIVVNEGGNVTDAKILRSVPLLDDAALKAVRLWQYTPTLVNGQAVPVRMTVTVNFSQTRSQPTQTERR